MRFVVWDHAGKSVYLQQKLAAAGHQPAETLEGADLFLLDCDWWWAQPRPHMIDAATQAGAKVALYPHGGWPTVQVYDGLTKPHPGVDVRLEHGEGPARVAAMLNLDLRQETVGWLYSPTRPFTPVEEPKRVLFAPQHPNMETVGSNGHDPGATLNQPIYRRLLELDYDVTVLFVGPAWKNGVWPHPRVSQAPNHQMLYQAAWQVVQGADVVIGTGTVAATAVASGKPTVMFGQDNLVDYIEGEYRLPATTGLYQALLRYPLDVGDGDLEDLIWQACQGDEHAAEWRDWFVGDDGTDIAVRLLEDLVGETKEQKVDAIIGGVTAKAGAKAGGE